MVVVSSQKIKLKNEKEHFTELENVASQSIWFLVVSVIRARMLDISITWYNKWYYKLQCIPLECTASALRSLDCSYFILL